MTLKEDPILTLKGVRVALTGYDEKGDLFCNYLKSSDGASTFNYDTKSYEECKELIEAMEGVVDSDLSSETQFIVARKGLTRKRLIGEKHGMWIVSPLFLDDASHNYELVKQHGTTSTKIKINDLQRIAGMYSVPYLYNYVLSASLLTNTEEETSLRRVVEQNGGRYYRAPLAFTDAVFISSEASTNLKLWIQRVVKDAHFLEAVEELEERKRLRGGNRLTTLRKLLYQPSEPVVNTEEILFAIVYDIPILNYHKFLSLSQLPPSGTHRKDAASVPPYDFDQLIEFCEVTVPVSLVNVFRFIESQQRDSVGSQSASPVRELAPKVNNNVMHSFSEDSSEADELESIASSFADYMEHRGGGDGLYSVVETGGTIEGDYFSQTANTAHRVEQDHLAPMVSKYFSVRPLEEGALALKPLHSSKPETHSDVKEKPFPLVVEKETTQGVEGTVDRRRLNLDFNSVLFSSLQISPFLTVAFLHCTPSEEVEGSIRCVGCRFLRVPILTGDVDVVILGKKCLRKKKYSPLSRENAPSKPKKQLREPSPRGKTKGEVSFYECTDHDLFHSLEKAFGITKNRIAPFAWLKECFQLMQEVIDTSNRVTYPTVKQDGSSVQSTWVEETAEAPTQSLYFTQTVESVNPKEPTTFDAKPFYASTVNPHTGTVQFSNRSLVEHFLPQLQAIGTGKYTIKLSRSVPPVKQRDTSPIKVEQSLKIGKTPSTVTVTVPLVVPPDTVQLTAPFTRPAGDHRTAPMEGKVTPKLDPPATVKTVPPTPEESYHREVQEIKQRLDSLWAIISSDENSEKTIQKTTVFKNVIFCFVEDDFSRTDLGVVRGLVNMGSGKCLKKTNDEWRQALSQQSNSLSDSTSNDIKPIRMNSLLGKKRKLWEDLLQGVDHSDTLLLKQRIRDSILSALAPSSTEATESSCTFPNHDSQWITDVSHSMSLSHFHLDNANSINNHNHNSNSAVNIPSLSEIESLIESIPKLMRIPSRVAAFYVEPHSLQTPSIYLAEGADRKQGDRAGGKRRMPFVISAV